MNEHAIAILDAMKRGAQTEGQIAAAASLSRAKVREQLDALMSEGKAEISHSAQIGRLCIPHYRPTKVVGQITPLPACPEAEFFDQCEVQLPRRRTRTFATPQAARHFVQTMGLGA